MHNTITGSPSQYTDTRMTSVHGCDISVCPWQLDGVCFSPANNTLHILERGMLPDDVSTGSLLWAFPLLYGGESTVYVQKMTGLNQTSLDAEIDNMPVTSGLVDATVRLDVHTFAQGGTVVTPTTSPVPYDKCTYNTLDLLTTAPVTFHQKGVDRIHLSGYSQNFTFSPNVYEMKSNLLCK